MDIRETSHLLSQVPISGFEDFFPFHDIWYSWSAAFCRGESIDVLQNIMDRQDWIETGAGKASNLIVPVSDWCQDHDCPYLHLHRFDDV